MLSAIVSSRLHAQLEFQAVGPWWIFKDDGKDESQPREQGDRGSEREALRFDSTTQINQKLHKIPSTREDVFADDLLTTRDKRSLMKFLRSVLFEQESEPALEVDHSDGETLSSQLTAQFGLAPSLHPPLLALSLSYDAGSAVRSKPAVSRIRRHLRSIGTFGPGFGAVMAKYGGGAEIAQVACRASAVGGAVYALGHRLEKVIDLGRNSIESQPSAEAIASLEFATGEKLKSCFVVGCAEDFPAGVANEASGRRSKDLVRMMHSICIVSSTLEHLLPPTSEDGPVPAAAMVIDMGDHQKGTPSQTSHASVSEILPVYMLVHSSESGECPVGQSKFYRLAFACRHYSNPDDHIQRILIYIVCNFSIADNYL